MKTLSFAILVSAFGLGGVRASPCAISAVTPHSSGAPAIHATSRPLRLRCPALVQPTCKKVSGETAPPSFVSDPLKLN
eukprot:180869-Amphidinium_carterae.1